MGFVFGSPAEAKVLRPDGAGDYSNWAGTTGTFDDVNEYPNNDGDNTFNGKNTADSKQSYNLPNNSDSGVIDGVRVVLYAKVDLGPVEYVTPFLRINGNDYLGDNCTTLTTTSYTRCEYYWAQNPNGPSAWQVNDLNNLQAGFKTTANGLWGGAEHRVSQMYVDVNFRAETKKTKYFVTQEVLPVSGAYDKEFSFAIADPIDEVRSAYIEIRGITGPVASMTVDAKVNDTAGTPGAYDKTYTIRANGRPTLIKIDHDVTDYFKEFVTTPGGYTKYLHLNLSSSVYVLQAKLIITYTWIVPAQQAGNYPISGELTSTVFNTGVADGATYNSIMWTGSLGTSNTGKVRFQFASSKCSNGASNPPDCNSGSWSFIGGNDCNNLNWYDAPTPGTPVEIKCAGQNHNNHRYYRYKVQICSNDCSSAGDYTPTVQSIVISWSP